MMRVMTKARFLSVALLAVLLLAGCRNADGGGSNGNGGGLFSGDKGGGRIGRQDRASAANMAKGEGTDFCDRYTAPAPIAYTPDGPDPFFPLPGEHRRGIEEPPVIILMYGDFQCAECAEVAMSLKQLVEERPEEVAVVFRHLPMTAVNDKAHLAAQAAEAAAEQGGEEAFWEMHDLLYERQNEWSVLSESSFFSVLANYADELGLDAEQFSADLGSEKFKDRVDFALSAASNLPGIQGAPFLMINDIPASAPPTSFDSVDLLAQIALVRQTYREKPPMEIDPEKDYVAWIETEQGDIALNLFADLAPETVNNFAYLACTGYYDNITWHRVMPGFVAQAGDPTGTGFGGPGYTIADEYANSDLQFDQAGWISMAKSTQPNSAGGQFFITLGTADHLNGAFTIFGQVVAGLDVVERIRPRDPSQTNEPGDALIRIIVREIDR